MTDQKSKDKGVILVLLERFNKQRLPRLKSLLEKVNEGQVLDEFDRQFIKQVETDSSEIRTLLDRNPEYKELATEALELLTEIMEKDIANQNN